MARKASRQKKKRKSGRARLQFSILFQPMATVNVKREFNAWILGMLKYKLIFSWMYFYIFSHTSHRERFCHNGFCRRRKQPFSLRRHGTGTQFYFMIFLVTIRTHSAAKAQRSGVTQYIHSQALSWHDWPTRGAADISWYFVEIYGIMLCDRLSPRNLCKHYKYCIYIVYVAHYYLNNNNIIWLIKLDDREWFLSDRTRGYCCAILHRSRFLAIRYITQIQNCHA